MMNNFKTVMRKRAECMTDMSDMLQDKYSYEILADD